MIRLLAGRVLPVSGALLARHPELAAVRFRRGGLPPRVAGWFLGRRSVAAVTLWTTVWLGDAASADEELLLHEARHVAQFRESWTFPIRYVVETLRHGYWNNRFEADAREYARQRVVSRERAGPDDHRR